eukprot:Opistho-2@18762
MACRQLLPDGMRHPLLQLVVEFVACVHQHKEYHALVRAHLLRDAQAVGNLRKGFNDMVDFRAAESDTRGIQRSVAPPEHPNASGGRADLHKVAVRPHTVVFAKVCASVLAAVGVVPEANGHRWERHCADKLAALIKHGVRAFVPALHLHAKISRLNLPPDDGNSRIRARKARDDVGAASDGAQKNILLDVCVHIVKTLWLERRSRRKDGANGRQLVGLDRVDVLILECRKPLCTSSKNSNANLVGKVPKCNWRRNKRRAVVENHSRPGCESADKPIPHHPAGGCVVEKDVRSREICVKAMFLEVLDEGAPGAVDHAFGDAGGARGEHHIQRVVERKLLELECGVWF